VGWFARAGVGGLAVAATLLFGELCMRIGVVLAVTGAGLAVACLVVERRVPDPPRLQRRLRYLARLTLLLFVLVLIRNDDPPGRPAPPVQVVRGKNLHLVAGSPVWEARTDREHRACVDEHPERRRILFVGTSITYGVGLKEDETFTAGLERELNAASPVPGVCVLNFAQPGFSSDQKLAVASVEIPRYEPDLVLWEVWNELADYRMLGSAAFALHDYALTADGFPQLARVPSGINRVLFLHSELYQYLTLGLGERLAQSPERFALDASFLKDRLTRFLDVAAAAGAKVAFYLAPPLDRPFAELVESPPTLHTQVLEFSREHGVPAFLLQQELAGEDFHEVRLDACCHYNARGHRALVPVFERIVRSAGPRR
jgi:hypothetical protein